jgi:hypothetical protein
LFDDAERASHVGVSSDALIALRAELDAAKLGMDKALNTVSALRAALSEMEGERNSLRGMVNSRASDINPRAETTYLNIIGGLLNLMLTESSGGQKGSIYESQSKIIDALLGHHNGKDGIAISTLQQKFAAAKRSIDAS